MKVVVTSNFALDNYDENIAILDGEKLEELSPTEAKDKCKLWNQKYSGPSAHRYAEVKYDEYIPRKWEP